MKRKYHTKKQTRTNTHRTKYNKDPNIKPRKTQQRDGHKYEKINPQPYKHAQTRIQQKGTTNNNNLKKKQSTTICKCRRRADTLRTKDTQTRIQQITITPTKTILKTFNK